MHIFYSLHRANLTAHYPFIHYDYGWGKTSYKWTIGGHGILDARHEWKRSKLPVIRKMGVPLKLVSLSPNIVPGILIAVVTYYWEIPDVSSGMRSSGSDEVVTAVHSATRAAVTFFKCGISVYVEFKRVNAAT